MSIFSADDDRALHIGAADTAVALEGTGPAAYLDIAAIVAAARGAGCDAVAPGYGFLSENADFAEACAAAGLTFVGPDAETLRRFGDKILAKRIARDAGAPVLSGDELGDVAASTAYMQSLPPGSAVMVKAAAGGGGRGIRLVRDPADLSAAIAQCSAEAEAAFGSGAVLVERYVARARHVEVQVIADGTGAVAVVGDRDCTVQRRNQKLIEIAPAPNLAPVLRERLHAAAHAIIAAAPYKGLATVEFLLDCDAPADSDNAFAFIEVNPRLQVEHTITEEVTGIDLVKTALRIAAGATLAELGIENGRPAHGCAIEARINAEVLDADGNARPSGGAIRTWHPPSGRGVRVDAMGYAGYSMNPRFDSLLAKVIVHGEDYPTALSRAVRALDEFRIDGPETSIPLLRAALERPELAEGAIDTRWFERTLNELQAAAAPSRRNYPDTGDASAPAPQNSTQAAPDGCVAVPSPLTGVVLAIDVGEGDSVTAGAEIGLAEALKMQHGLTADVSGIVRAVLVKPGEQLREGEPILFIEPSDTGNVVERTEDVVDPDHIRPDLAELWTRIGYGLDANRPEAVARRHKSGQRTARENIDDLFDTGSFREYGALAIAAQRSRRSEAELMRETPADGLIGGIGTVNAAQFGAETARCMAMSYDYMVMAGTQGYFNHHKTDRLIEVAERGEMPVVFFTEGGGGRPGDVDAPGISGLATPSFRNFARLSGKAPRIGIASGYCFAGNAVLFGSCDITIATRNANIGMGGPAMIEGGGLGVFHPREIGPSDVQTASGVIDVLVEDEAEATQAARTLLSIFQGRVADPGHADQRLLRHVIPENRQRVYDMRGLIALLADTDSFVELRAGFARGMITGFLRIGGRPLGLIANDPKQQSGVIDSDCADKAARFMQLCDAYGVPILSLCDTPGFMVGPESEKSAPVRHGARMFTVAASLSVPFFTVVVRRGYGLGAQAMSGGSFHAPAFTISWPSGEFGGMGLEGAVRLGFRRELEAIADLEARDQRYRELVAAMYARGKAVSVAQYLEIDAVIDPADTRAWIERGLDSHPTRRGGRFIDTW